MAREVLMSMAGGPFHSFIQTALIDSVVLSKKREHEVGKGMEEIWEELKGNGECICSEYIIYMCEITNE